MSRETIVGELAGRPAFTTSETGPDHLRACLIVEGHATLPEVLTVELRSRNAAVAAARLADADGQLVTAELWTGPAHNWADLPPDRLSPHRPVRGPAHRRHDPPDLARGSTTHDRTQRPEGGRTP